MDVKTIAVVARARWGGGLPMLLLSAATITVLEDVSRHVLSQGVAGSGNLSTKGVARGKVEAAVRDKALSLISTANNVEDAIRDAELIIELCRKELEMKLELFTILRQVCQDGRHFCKQHIFAFDHGFTDVTVSRDRCIGMHFFNPVPKMKLIELVEDAAILRMKRWPRAAKLRVAWARKW